MSYENIKSSINDYSGYFESSKENCYINNKQLSTCLKDSFISDTYSKLTDNKDISSKKNVKIENDSKKDTKSTKPKEEKISKKESLNSQKKEKKNNVRLSINEQKLLEAYNEGYYGMSNIPKQFYIYPKFSRHENILENKINNKTYNKINNNIDTIYNKYQKKINDNNNNDLISSYINYPYPKLINISSNLFGLFHQKKEITNEQNLKSEKKNTTENNPCDEMYNKTFEISFKTKENNYLKFKGSGKIVDFVKDKKNATEKTETKNHNTEKENDLGNNLNSSSEDNGNFYYINNNITKRNAPYNNFRDDSSIDDDCEEKTKDN